MPNGWAASAAGTGGDATNDFGEYRIHTFNFDGTFTFTKTGDVEVLVVGGGGGGGETIGGGGGGGGVIYSNAYPMTAGVYAVTVGGGGYGGWGGGYPPGGKGTNSTFATLTAIGGGAGAGYNENASGTGGSAGGNGGGGGLRAGYTAGQGNDGGNGYGNNAGGGAGGGSQTGFPATATSSGTGGAGGCGVTSSISGSAVVYAGGGGGGTRTGCGAAGAGGSGGGGAGGTAGNGGSVGTNGLGGGGGGGGFTSDMPGGRGGSGIVIVRYSLYTENISIVARSATTVSVSRATLNGRLLGDGNDTNTTIVFCWGLSDAGTNSGTSAWANVTSMGTNWCKGQYFSTNLVGLLSGSNYFYRCYATNTTGEAWSEDAFSFTMLTPVTASGGATVETNGYRIHTFATNGAFTVTETGQVEVLVVGGGGGGGETIGGGGGGGGVIYSNAYSMTAGVFTVTIGGGGYGGWGGGYPPGGKGTNSTFATLTAIGGGAGAGYNENASGTGGSAGGNGGGGGLRAGYTVGQGYDGGNGYGNNAGGGGGGGSQTGFPATATSSGTGGAGGCGVTSSISGSAVVYAGGGGGATRNGCGAAGAGGDGGGGAGGTSGAAGSAGTDGLGGGGGGGGYNGSEWPGGRGGSGIVIVRYPMRLTVQDFPASAVGPTNANLNGRLVYDDGCAPTAIAFCWGYTNSGAGSTSDWPNVVDMGSSWANGQSFSNTVTGLLSGSSYVYRVFASNTAGTAWSAPRSFTAAYAPAVTNLGAVDGRIATWLQGQITDAGGSGELPFVWFYYWAVGGSETSVVAMGQQSGVFSNGLGGLVPGVTYAYRILASNQVASVWSEDDTFLTLASFWYVSPGGSDSSNGTSWAEAFGTVGKAVGSSAAGDTIFLRYGIFTNSSQITITNHPYLKLRGGYLGTPGGTPGGTTSTPSVITRDGSGIRIFYCTNSTITFDSLVVSNGYLGTGGGIYLDSCAALLTNCVLTKNGTGSGVAGGGIYALKGPLTVVDSVLRDNAYPQTGSGGAIYGNNVVLTLLRTTFSGNILGTGYTGGSRYGGALWLSGSNALIQNCTFQNNGLNWDWIAEGGALYSSSVNPLVISNTVFTACFGSGNNPKGAVLYLGSGVSAAIRDSDLSFNSGSSGDIYLDTGNGVGVFNTRIASGQGYGIYKPGSGALGITNCLITGHLSDGIRPTAGTVSIASSTFANNGGWGVTNAGATSVILKDSILWGNTIGGWAGSGVSATYTDSQETHAGAGNLVTNPQFVAGYFLSSNGLPFQSVSSPCFDLGSDTAASLGLNTRYTTTDGVGDGGQVDLGYHSSSNYSSSISNMILYVNIGTGSDTNDGLTAGTALKTITKSFTKAIDGSTINVASGVHSTAAGETLPLVIPLDRIKLKGDNRATVIDANKASRILQAASKTGLWLEGLTVTNGLASDSYGNGIYLASCGTTITNCTIAKNGKYAGGSGIYGGGIYVWGGSLNILGSTLFGNGFTPYNGASGGQGGGFYAGYAAVTLDNVLFDSNIMNSYDTTVGGICYMIGGSLVARNCTFNNNFTCGYQNAGGMHLDSLSSLTVSNCVFTGNSASGWNSQYGVIYLNGGGVNQIVDCSFSANSAVGTIFDNLSSGSLRIWNSVLSDNTGIGFSKVNTATLGMTNCLVTGHTSDGVRNTAAATIGIANTTFADNLGGWGLNCSAGTVTLINSILWGNLSGGWTGGGITATYTDAQEDHAGTGNTNTNPQFASGYYLSVDGVHGQTVNSPCIDIGSAAASTFGLDARTTRTDGTNDASAVDLGYHYAAGLSPSTLSNLVLYVNANPPGSDSNDGRTPETAFKTFTKALASTVANGTINVATGTYDAALGETFPLVIPQSGVRVKATNRTATIVNAGGANRIFQASNKSGLWFEGLVVTNGVANYGSGFYLSSCGTTITNCLITRNGRLAAGAAIYGGGVYAYGGSLSILNCTLSTNGFTPFNGASGGQGAGFYAAYAAVTLDNVLFDRNIMNSYDTSIGGICYMYGGSLVARNCTFKQNYTRGYQNAGGMHLDSLSSLTLSNCFFTGNAASGWNSQYGIVYLNGGGANLIVDCSLATNSAVGAVYDNLGSGSMAIHRCIFARNISHGVCKSGASVDGVTNTLFYAQTNDAINVAAGTLSIGNSTIVTNKGYGVNRSGGTVTLNNSIVWDNIQGGLNGSVTVAFSDTQGGAAGGNGNISADPLFTLATNSDYSLRDVSPCKNTGTNEAWMASARDLAGNPRLAGTVEMGAYEFPAVIGNIFTFH